MFGNRMCFGNPLGGVKVTVRLSVNVKRAKELLMVQLLYKPLLIRM